MRASVEIVDGPIGGESCPECAAGTGSVLRFEGVVRGDEDGRAIEGIEYETYDPMAERELQRLADESAERFGLMAMRVVHSRGVVVVGEVSLVVWVGSAHRRASLDAMDWFITALKKDVPIWKRPRFVGAEQVGEKA